MKTRCLEPVRFLSMLWLIVWAVVPRAAGQTRPSLGLGFSAGQVRLNLAGQVGTVYSIQYASGLSATNVWEDRTLLQAQGASTVWADPSPPTAGQRFYRAVFVPAPADTNLVFIEPGTFMMGSPTNQAERDTNEVQHIVTISRGFWMEKFLVTQGDYLAVVGSNPSWFNGVRSRYDPTCFCYRNVDYGTNLTRPVETVNWYDATNYCAMRTQQERAGGLIPTNYVYRLPTESEWEYACRAGMTTPFYLGSGLHSGQANFDGQYEYDASVGTVYNARGIYLSQTTAVGSYAANGWGLYDMIGNVEEWCQDWLGNYPVGSVTDPQGAVTGSSRVVRGGDWCTIAGYCRSAFRDYSYPGYRYSSFGFRVVLAPGQP